MAGLTKRRALGGVLAVVLALWLRGLLEFSCDPAKGPDGQKYCWDPEPSPEVANLTIDPASVPTLPLLGGGGLPLSGLGLCCRPSAKGDEVRQGVLDFLMMGGRALDTATVYWNHRKVGLGIRQAIAGGVPRSAIFLTTKIPPHLFGAEEASAWVSRTLEELGLDYIDLVLLHWAGTSNNAGCTTPKVCRQETWRVLQRAQQRGQIKHLGVSNFGPRQMEEILSLGGAPIEVNQLEYHPWVPQVHRDAVEWCQQRGIAVTAYGSMGSKQTQQVLSRDVLRRIGDAHAKTSGQVLLRWAVQKNVSVIPGTGNPRHMAENLQIFDFELRPEEMSLLDSVPESERMLHFDHWPDSRQ